MIDETIEEIQAMQTHSSSAVAIKAARSLRTLLDREFAAFEEFERTLNRNAAALRRANPSHASLHNAMSDVVDAVESAEPTSVAGAKSATSDAIDQVIDRIEGGKQRAAERASVHLDDGTTVLTHDYSSTVLESFEKAVSKDKQFKVYVSEARPRYLGRKTARALASFEQIDTTLVVDSAWGHVLDGCDAVYVGMDCIVGETLYNRVGTFPLCATANELSVPVYVVGSASKLVNAGFVFENEYRATSEVIREPPEGFSVENPAYDATPLQLIDAVITDTAVMSPESM